MIVPLVLISVKNLLHFQQQQNLKKLVQFDICSILINLLIFAYERALCLCYRLHSLRCISEEDIVQEVN